MKKQRTITSIMTVIFSITILVQVAVLLSIVYIGKVPQTIREESYQNFDKNITESYNSVKSIFDQKFRIENYIRQINFDIYKYFGSKDNVSKSSKDHQLGFLETVPELLITIIGQTQSNGAFIILENENASVNDVIQREGIYISFNPSNNYYIGYEANILNKNLNINIPNLIKGYDDEYFEIDISNENNKFYSTIMNHSKLYGIIVDFPFISSRYQSYLEGQVINITYPITDSYGRCIAIFGIEFLVSEFLKITTGNQDISYVIGYTDNNTFKINSVLSWGKKFKFLKYKNIEISNLPTLDKYYSLANDNEVAISLNRLNIKFYEDNRNPYTNENWIFVGFISTNALISNSNYVENVILIIISLSLVFGALMIWITVKGVANPIKELSNQVQNLPTNEYYEFEKSKLEEVNNLIVAFEKLSYDILQYSNKLTNAINTFLLGIYFYQDEENDVFCTQPFLDMCGANLKEGYINREIFNRIKEDIVNSYYDERYEAYQLSSDRWIKLETKIESSFTLGIVTDITEQVNEVKKMEKELDVDGLTKLYNRIAFQKLSTKFLEKNSSKDVAVIMWDIDKLRYINNRYGHEAGDRYIEEFANAIRILEDYDAIVARRSGDEFFAIITGKDKNEILKIIEKVKSLINKCEIEISDEITEKVRASVGIAWYPENGLDVKSLLNYADKQLYQSKFEFSGLTNVVSTNVEQHVNLFHFNKELAKIIDGDYVTFAYQPIVDAKNGEIFGYEMLMRIFSDILNNPKKLIDIARENEKLDVIEELTFKKGFESYQMNISNINNKKIFINSISKISLADRVINELLELTNNNLDMLVVELTGLLSADKTKVIDKINKFKSLNAQIAIDNFKLEFIEAFNLDINVDFIKVDISIINDIESSAEQQKVLVDIIKFAKSNNYKVIAVGIKNYEELKIVINSGVDYLQGYYLAEPTVKPSNIRNEVISEIKKLQD